MKAKGRFNTLIENHNNHTDDSSVEGFAVAAVGTKRVAYWSFKGGWTYDEKEARIWARKSDATAILGSLDAEMFSYSRIVRVDGDETNVKGGKFPTVNGY